MTTNKNTVAVYTLVQPGWWATWTPGEAVVVHADDQVPTDTEDLLSLADWDAYNTEDNADGADVREQLEDLGFAVVEWEWRELVA